MVRQLQINLSDKLYYTIIALVVLVLLSVGVYAYNSGQTPDVIGHSAEELEVDLSGVCLSNGTNCFIEPTKNIVTVSHWCDKAGNEGGDPGSCYRMADSTNTAVYCPDGYVMTGCTGYVKGPVCKHDNGYICEYRGSTITSTGPGQSSLCKAWSAHSSNVGGTWTVEARAACIEA